MSAAIELVQDQQRVTCTIGPVTLPGVLVADGSAWLTQAEMATLFGCTKQNVGMHISSVIEDGELRTEACVKQLFTQARGGGKDGNGTRNVEVSHYSTDMVVAVGFKVRSERGVEFRQWANRVIHGEVPESTQRAIQLAVTQQVIAALRSVLIAELAPVLNQLAAIDSQYAAQKTVLSELQADMARVSSGSITSRERSEIKQAVAEAVKRELSMHSGANPKSLTQRFYRELKEATKWDGKFDLLPTALMPLARQALQAIKTRQQRTAVDIAVSRQVEMFNKGAA